MMASHTFEPPIPNCTIGTLMNTPCHLKSYIKQDELMMFADLDQIDRQLIVLRTSLKLTPLDTICGHHISMYLTCYVQLQRTCANPFESHRKVIYLSKGKQSPNITCIHKYYSLIVGACLINN